MTSAPLPSDESERLEALRQYGVLGTPPEERFDRIVRLVSRQLGVTTTAVSLVDVDRLWFKASVGLHVKEGPRDRAFCSHAILSDSTLVVENALEDERFADSPYVTAEDGIRFYAGAPLVTAAGQRLGTLCAIHPEPRGLTEDEEAFLRDMAAIVMDVLELSVAGRSLIARSEALAERNKSLDAFVQMLAHDLAGPIRRIKGFGELLVIDDGPPLEDCARHILSSAETADRLLADLRAFFVVDQPHTETKCDPRECLDRALQSLAVAIEASEARVEVTGDFPTLNIYPGLLTSLFQNLAENGIKYRAYGRPPLISIHGVLNGNRWECSVRDNGIGIEEEYQERVFEFLFRLHSEAEIPGSGMGLPICAKIVSRNGGTIRLESAHGEGTCVTFTLPTEAGTSVQDGSEPDALVAA